MNYPITGQFHFSLFSKILETVYKRIVSFLNKHNLISDAQSGFGEKNSTFAAIQSFIEDVQKALGNKLFAMGIFLDLSKAFDVINHKFELYGIRGNSYSLISSYLTGRSQFVEIQHIDAKTSSLMTFASSCKDLN
jgi:hypothetical protein